MIDMHVDTYVLDSGARNIRKHCRNIENVTRALMHNVKVAHSEFTSENYDKTLEVVRSVEKSVLDFSIRVDEIKRYTDRLSDCVEEYNSCGYGG